MAAQGLLPHGANVCVTTPSSQIGSKKPSLPLVVGSFKSSYRGSGERCKLPHLGLERSPSENRIWCILALMIPRSGQTRKVPNNCQAVTRVESLSGLATVLVSHLSATVAYQRNRRIRSQVRSGLFFNSRIKYTAKLHNTKLYSEIYTVTHNKFIQ